MQIALGGVLLVAPWLMGGRHPAGQLFLAVLAVGGIAAWGLGAWKRCGATHWNLSPAHLFVFAGIALVGLQLLPLPQALLHLLSPKLKEILPLWMADAQSPVNLGSWSLVSLVPSETRGALVMLVVYGLLFCIALQHLRSVESIERLLSCLGFSVVLLASIGLLQYQFGNGRFLWVYEHPFRTTAGAGWDRLQIQITSPIFWRRFWPPGVAVATRHSSPSRGTARVGSMGGMREAPRPGGRSCGGSSPWASCCWRG